MNNEATKCLKSPCKECPFSRTVVPGTLGGSGVEVYIGQAQGPFYLPCHAHTDYADPNWKKDDGKPQCAGAAIYRSNIGVAKLMPKEIHILPPDKEKVFRAPEEFIMHHQQVPSFIAQMFLQVYPPQMLMMMELSKQETWIKKATPQPL